MGCASSAEAAAAARPRDGGHGGLPAGDDDVNAAAETPDKFEARVRVPTLTGEDVLQNNDRKDFENGYRSGGETPKTPMSEGVESHGTVESRHRQEAARRNEAKAQEHAGPAADLYSHLDIDFDEHPCGEDSDILDDEDTDSDTNTGSFYSQRSKGNGSKKRRSARNSLRPSFRMSRKHLSKLHTEWGAEELEVGSVQRKRRLSEQSLARVMQDSTIRERFEAYLKSENVGNVLETWDALQSFGRRPEAACAKKPTQERAQELYELFFCEQQLQMQNNMLLSIVSRETIRDLSIDLMIDKSGRVNQHNVSIIDNAFRVLHLRVHNSLKYEFLPGFLISEQFQSLYENYQPTEKSTIDLRFDNGLDLKQSEPLRIDVKPVPQMGEEDIKSRSHVLGQQLEVVELHDELETLCESGLDEESKLRRLNRVLHRYASPKQDLIHPRIKALDELYAQLVSQQGEHTGASPSATSMVLVAKLPSDLDRILGPVRESVLNRIGQRLVPAFKRSSTYKKMISHTSSGLASIATPSAPDDLERQSSTETFNSSAPAEASPGIGAAALSPSTGQTIANLECLQTYCENVNVRPGLFGFSRAPQGEVTLDEVLSSAYGALQFKRFARRLFQEENVLFLVKARQFRANASSAVSHDVYELLHFAQEICNQYITPGSPLEINISDTQRSDTLDEFHRLSTAFFEGLKSGGGAPDLRAEDLGHLFDVAVQEIRTIVLRGLWDEFRDDATYGNGVQVKFETARSKINLD
ncbi:Regulator of G-protein signaling 5 [Hondaea fermentalgiana]|uniref:Regulator of G-protein signaling 5 n=1 Tax=Hondaea fermentalgiana TaxID=2315210 RepID=A0A2R5GFM8_9STRA|nr:Regulator of G-protein signaling 5 [Hondaea fermentalgiana]|eukprot:GBG27443.1 Regulator of G-protein signaling 5 [Hondaea fermentalgiana]